MTSKNLSFVEKNEEGKLTRFWPSSFPDQMSFEERCKFGNEAAVELIQYLKECDNPSILRKIAIDMDMRDAASIGFMTTIAQAAAS